jgi:hypothetical protein
MKSKINTTLFGTVPKIVERGKIDTTNTQIHDSSLSWLGTVTLINSGEIKQVLSVQTCEFI